MDPFRALASFILGKFEQSLIARWAKFLFCLGFSGIVTFLGVCGVMLAGSGDYALAIGSGMITSAVMMLAVYFGWPDGNLRKGMFIAVPENLVEKQSDPKIDRIQD